MSVRIALIAFAAALTTCAPSVRNGTPLAKDGPKTDATGTQLLKKVADVPNSTGPLRLYCVSRDELLIYDNRNLWRFTNPGSWTLQYTSKSESENIKTIQFINANLGWMLRYDGLYKTEDACVTWISQASSLPGYPKADLQDFKFSADGMIGWAVGGLYRPLTPSELRGSPPPNVLSPDRKAVVTAAIYHTLDAGQTWLQQSVPATPGRFLSVVLADSTHAVVIGDGGVYGTDNGGETWLPIKFNRQCSTASDTTTVPIDVSFVGVTGWLTYTNGYVASTVDGGKTWCDLTFGEDIWPKDYQPAYFEKIHFTSGSHGWALGGDRLLYETDDGGKKWKRADESMRFNYMYFSNDCGGWLVSHDGVFRVMR